MRTSAIPRLLNLLLFIVALVLEACGGDDATITTTNVTSSTSGGSTTSGGSSGGSSSSGGSTGGAPSAVEVTIAGTVAGLRGNGLALSLNGGTPTNVNGATFSLGTLKDGEAFTVAVTAQPSSPAQTCTVDGASGTARAGANVDVRVTCVTNVYAVGGKITGLLGTGLVLRNNGEPLNVAPTGGSDVTFTFPTKIESGASYAITIDASPVGPTETCSVDAKGAGVVGAVDISDIVITCSTESYSVGGVVKDLAGLGLKLRVNTQTIDLGLVAAASGEFSFTAPSKIASGATYDVTVEQQPRTPTQVCVVGSGKGRVSSANVTNVVVTCTTSTYSIGGQVSGLVGTGLILRTNGQAISIGGGPNVPFTFPVKLASGTPYAVTVEANPSGPAQNCSVDARGSGNVPDANVTNVVVMCSSSSYAVGGRVKNINPTGSGITLRNAGETLFVPPNSGPDAPFTFPTKLASGSSYAVSVEASPYDSCVVVNGAGSVNSVDVTTIEINCTTLNQVVPETLFVMGAGQLTSVRLDGTINLPNPFTPGPVPALGTISAAGKVCFDSAGNIYQTFRTAVRKVSASGTQLAVFTAGFAGKGLTDCVVDDAGNVLLTAFNTGEILSLAPTGTVSLFMTLANPTSITRGPGVGELYVSTNAGTVRSFDASGNVRAGWGVGGVVNVPGVLPSIVLDTDRNLYVVSQSTSTVHRVTASGATVSTAVVLPASNYTSLAIDSLDNLYISEAGGTNRILRFVTRGGGGITTLVSLPSVNAKIGIRRDP